jgi:hypothetical protein
MSSEAARKQEKDYTKEVEALVPEATKLAQVRLHFVLEIEIYVEEAVPCWPCCVVGFLRWSL